MRPNYVVTASDKDGRLVLYGLYYNGRKAQRAFKKLQTRASDDSYTISYEDGRHESVFGVSGDLIVKIRYLGDHIWTDRLPWKKSFFDTTEEEFHQLATSHDIPVRILKEIAHYERDYIEDRGSCRWSARKRAYLPRFLYDWI